MAREAQERAAAVFKELQSRPDNKLCVDCQRPNPQWASVSHGTFLCIQCSGVHRSMGVHISFVRSCTMDSWTPQQLAMMEAGGNAAMLEYFKYQGVGNSVPQEEKYDCEALRLYRAKVKAVAEGKPAPQIPRVGYTSEKPKPRASPPPLASSPSHAAARANTYGPGGAGSASRPDMSVLNQPIRSTGKMQGFGSQPVDSSQQQGDFYSNVADAFFSVAQYTQDAASAVAAKSKVVASSLAEKSRTALGDKDISTSVKSATTSGWNALSSVLNSVVTSASQLTASLADSSEEPVPRAFGIQPVGSHTMPSLSSTSASTDDNSSSRRPSSSGRASDPADDEDNNRLKYSYRGSHSKQSSSGSASSAKKSNDWEGGSDDADDNSLHLKQSRIQRGVSAPTPTPSGKSGVSSPKSGAGNKSAKGNSLDDVLNDLDSWSFDSPAPTASSTPAPKRPTSAFKSSPSSSVSASPVPSIPAALAPEAVSPAPLARTPSPSTAGNGNSTMTPPAALTAAARSTSKPSSNAALSTTDFFADFGLDASSPSLPKSKPASSPSGQKPINSAAATKRVSADSDLSDLLN